MTAIGITLNGRKHAVTVEPLDRLLDLVRRLGATDVKEGCGEGECGACTVLMDGRPVASCLVLAAQADGAEIITVSGLSEDGLDAVQQALLDLGAVQCGFCTPGMVLTARALLDSNPSPSRDEIRAALAGNLCRCTGYERIIDAVEMAAAGGSRSLLRPEGPGPGGDSGGGDS
jgi:aerobic carbon-monoxide dehydrogenase small subunit